MKERRKAKRYPVEEFIRHQKIGRMKLFFSVFDCSANYPIGHVVDISSAGILIIMKEPVEPGATLQLRIDLPDNTAGVDSMCVGARCVRAEKDEGGEFYYAGFEFTTMSPDCAEVLKSIFESKSASAGINLTRMVIIDD